MNETITGHEVEQTTSLSRTERMHLTWALAWPCILLGLVYSLVRGQLRLPEGQLVSIDEALGILQLFFFATWVVRRTVRMDFPGFHLLVIRGDAVGGQRTMKYGESLSVAWLICWRTSMFYLPFVVVAAIALHGQPALMYGLRGWLFTSLLELPIFYAWIVRAAVGKRYSGFSLSLERSALGNA